MSARFGRNQRRKLRGEVASLQRQVAVRDDAIASLRTGDWKRADGSFPDLANMVRHVLSYDIREGVDNRGMKSRTADITAMTGTGYDGRDLCDVMDRGGLIEWNGGVWYVRDFRVELPDDHGIILDWPTIEMKMSALPRDGISLSERRYAFRDDRMPQVSHRAIGGRQFYDADPRPLIRVA